MLTWKDFPLRIIWFSPWTLIINFHFKYLVNVINLFLAKEYLAIMLSGLAFCIHTKSQILIQHCSKDLLCTCSNPTCDILKAFVQNLSQINHIFSLSPSMGQPSMDFVSLSLFLKLLRHTQWRPTLIFSPLWPPMKHKEWFSWNGQN